MSTSEDGLPTRSLPRTMSSLLSLCVLGSTPLNFWNWQPPLSDHLGLVVGVRHLHLEAAVLERRVEVDPARFQVDP